MPNLSDHETRPWIAFLAGGVAVLAFLLAIFALTRGERLADTLRYALRDAPSLHRSWRLPETPRVPAPPIPLPR